MNSDSQKIILEKILAFLENLSPKAKIYKSSQDWQKILPDEVYQIARQKDTERPFSGQYCGLKADGNYYCKVCGQYLFGADSKFDSGTGWPSYFRPANEFSLIEAEDNSYFMKRVEVLCARCESHLGHVFDDGPEPTKKRYCINSLVLDFVPVGQTLSLLPRADLSQEELNFLQNLPIIDDLEKIFGDLNENRIGLDKARQKVVALF